MRKHLDGALLFGACAVLLFGTDYRIFGDGQPRFLWLVSVLAPERLSPELLAAEPDLHKYAMTGPLFAAPLFLLGMALGTMGLIERYNALLVIGGLAVQCWLLRSVLPRAVRLRYATLAMTASLLAFHVRFFYGDVFTAMVVTTALTAVAVGYVRSGWSLAALGVTNTPAHLMGFGLAALRAGWSSRRLRVLLAVVLAALLVALEHVVRLGSLRTEYGGDAGIRTVMPYSGLPGFSYPLWLGLMGLLLSFGKGLLWFAPGVLLPAWRRLAEPERAPALELHRLWLVYLAGLLPVYACWWAWYGGWTFGPRFLVMAALPASLALALYLERPPASVLGSAGVLSVLALSIWVGMTGLVFGTSLLEPLGQSSGYQHEHLTWFVPEFSALWRPLVAEAPLRPRDVAVLAYGMLLFVHLGAGPLVVCVRGMRHGIGELAKQLGAGGVRW